MITYRQFIRAQAGFFRVSHSQTTPGTHKVEFVVGQQPEAEFDGVTTQQLQGLEQAIHNHLNPPAAGAAAGGT